MPKETNLFSQHALSLRIQSNFVEQGLYLFVFYKCFRVFSSYIFGKEPLPTLLSSKYQVQKNPRYYFSFDALNDTGDFPSSQTLEKYSLPSPSTQPFRLSTPVRLSLPRWPGGCAGAVWLARHGRFFPRCWTAAGLSVLPGIDSPVFIGSTGSVHPDTGATAAPGPRGNQVRTPVVSFPHSRIRASAGSVRIHRSWTPGRHWKTTYYHGLKGAFLVDHHYQRFPQHFQLESIDIHESPPILATKKQPSGCLYFI